MSEKSDIKGVAFCTLLAIMIVGAGVVFLGELSLAIAGNPNYSPFKAIAAGGWAFFLISAIVAYARHPSIDLDLEEI